MSRPLPFTTLASSVNSKTSKKSMQKRRGGFWCLDTPQAVALFLSCFCSKFYSLPTTRCENDTICHTFLSSFTVYRPKKNATVLGVSRPLRPRHTKKTPRFFARFSLKFCRLPTTRASFTVKLQRKACKKTRRVFWCVKILTCTLFIRV